MTRGPDFSFVHIPRTAGKSITHALRDSGAAYGGTHHYRVSQARARHSVEAVYAFCRDPVDRFVSAVMRRRRCVPGRAKGHPLTSLVRGTQKLKPQEALETVMDGWDSAWLEDMHPATEMFRPQSYWLDEPVTFLGRFEHLQEDFAALCEILETYATLKHLNASLRDGVIVTSRIEQFVQRFYAADFDLHTNMTRM